MGTHEAGRGGKGGGSLSVTVDNEIDGRRLAIPVGHRDPVQCAIDGLYERLGRGPGSDDSLRCAVSEEDVPFFADLEITEYRRQCPDLHWLFAAPTGGASEWSRPKISAADPEAAAEKLEEHLDALWASGGPDAQGWRRFQLDPLRWVVVMPATDSEGRSTHFLVRLDGRRYDQWPPEVQFVEPDTWEPASGGRWWPETDPLADRSRPRWFGLHPMYDFHDGDPRPLVCFGHALGCYESSHSPTPDVRWVQGEHTVASTLECVAKILSPPYFRGVSP
jgi:hypothetical protein